MYTTESVSETKEGEIFLRLHQRSCSLLAIAFQSCFSLFQNVVSNPLKVRLTTQTEASASSPIRPPAEVPWTTTRRIWRPLTVLRHICFIWTSWKNFELKLASNVEAQQPHLQLLTVLALHRQPQVAAQYTRFQQPRRATVQEAMLLWPLPNRKRIRPPPLWQPEVNQLITPRM